MVDGEVLALEVVEPGAAELARLERLHERVGVVERGARRVDVDRALLHAIELRGTDHAGRLGRDHRVHRHHIGFGEQLVERVRGVGVRTGRRRSRASRGPRSATSARAPDGTEADDAGGAPRDLPRAVALVGDRAVAVHLALAHIGVGGHDACGSPRTAARRVISATASALRPGARSTGMPLAVAVSMSTLLGSPRHEPMASSGRSSTGPLTESDSTMRRSAPSAVTISASCSPLRSRIGWWSIHGSITTSAMPRSVSSPSPRKGRSPVPCASCSCPDHSTRHAGSTRSGRYSGCSVSQRDAAAALDSFFLLMNL